MNSVKTGHIIALFFACTFLSACGGTADSNAANHSGAANANAAAVNANSARTNAEELGLLVNMPYETDEIVWKEDQPHKKIIAVMRFSPEDSKRIVADAEKIKAPEKVTIPTATWFPAELIAQGDMGGEDNVNGLAYAANAFFQEHYDQGRLVHVEDTDYFVLEVSAAK
jgi:hypothetical protein